MPESLAVELAHGVFVNHSIECDLGDDCDCQPAYGTRASEPGPRGCWAVKANGAPCGAARRRDGDFCGAHSGIGVAADPGRYAAIGQRASAESRTRRKELRHSLGITRPNTARGTLRALVFVERERIARAALAPIGSSDPALAHRAALALLDAVEPHERVELVTQLPTDPAAIAGMGLEELERLEAQGALDV
jgi:hypothetical protein